MCFGLDNTVVSTRRSRLTYGAGVLKRFVRGQHPDAKLLRRDGSDWCRDVFDPYVVVDQVRSQQWRRHGGSFPLWVDVQKLCNMCVLSLSWNFFVSHDRYIARPSSKEPR